MPKTLQTSLEQRVAEPNMTPSRKKNLMKICIADFTDNMLERALAKFEELKLEAINDCTFDEELMFTKPKEQFDNALCRSKWIGYKAHFQEVVRQIKLKSDRKKCSLQEEYKIHSPLKLSTKAEVDLFVNTDENYALEYNTLITLDTIIEYIDGILIALKDKNFEVARFIDWQKFVNGK